MRREIPPEKCQGTPQTFGFCERKPAVVRDGKNYCWQHDPVRLDRLADDRRAKNRQAEEVSERRWARDRLIRRSGVHDLTDAELEQVVALGGVRKMIERIEQGGRPT